jgi:ribonuclease HII
VGAAKRKPAFQPLAWLDAPMTYPKTNFERETAAAGNVLIAGVDEAGRGPLAGPIVAAAVILGTYIEGLDDSKRLTEEARESFFDSITGGGNAVGVAIIPAERIDRAGIQCANYEAMTQALAALDPQPDFALVDGFNVPGCSVRHRKISKGDQLSCSIAAASIVAKVTRDRMMRALHEQYPDYGFAQHKGYGTAAHLAAIEKHGPCPAHRRSFAPLALRTETALLTMERMETA